MSEHLDSLDAELKQNEFLRMFALGCFDAFITLPISITLVVTNIVSEGPAFNFYQGWTFIHSDWEPVFVPKSIWSASKWSVVLVNWDGWVNPFYVLVFFALFGLTPEARKRYCNLFHFLGKPFGVRQTESAEESLPDVSFQTGRGTNATVTSNISSRSGLRLVSAREHLLIISCCSQSADVSA